MLNKYTFSIISSFLCFVPIWAQQSCGYTPKQTAPKETCQEACIYCSISDYQGQTSNYTSSGAMACFTVDNDQWLGFTASTDSVTINVYPNNCSKKNGVQIALYDNCGGMPLACNPGGIGQGNQTCSISSSLIPGNNYYLMIDGYEGDLCRFFLTIDPTDVVIPVESCEEISVDCNFCGYAICIAGYAPNPAPPGGFCGTIENDLWLGFVASASSATFTIKPSNCVQGNGLQAAIYDKCTGTPIVCNAGITGGGNKPIELNINMVPGQNYYLLVDGMNGDVCDLMVSVDPPDAVKPPSVGAIGPINGTSLICPGGTTTYEVAPVAGAGYYTWTGPAGTLINGEAAPVTLPAPNGRRAKITFPMTVGNAQICVTAFNSCKNGPTQCKTVSIQPIPPTIAQTEYICFEDIGNEPCGFFENTYTSFYGCDSIVRKRIVCLPQIKSNIGFKYLCAGDTLEVCGLKFYETGQIVALGRSFLGCDSLVTGYLTILDPIAKILNKGGLACTGNNGVITLRTAPSQPGTVKTWQRNGVPLGVADSLEITSPGTYILTSSLQLGGVKCQKTDVAIIVTGVKGPPPTIQLVSNGPISCPNPSPTLSVNSTSSLINYQWDGYGLEAYYGPTPQISNAGHYYVTVTDQNGCTNSTSVSIKGDTLKPVIFSITKSPLGGLGAIKGRLICKVSAPNFKFNWEGPDAFTSTLQNPLVYTIGTYTVTVTNPFNLCTATATFDLMDKNKPGKTQAKKPESGEDRGVTTTLLPHWRLYPNPSQGTLNIAHVGVFSPEKVTLNIYDPLGRIVYQANHDGAAAYSVDLPGATPGLYVLEINEIGISVSPPQRFRFIIQQ